MGDADYDAVAPTIAYNPDAREYLVGWIADDNTGGQIDNEYEAFVQRLGQGGGQVQGDKRVTELGGLGDANFDAASSGPSATSPDTVGLDYNPVAKNYLLAVAGDDTVPGDNDYEVWGQLLDSAAEKVGARLRLSDMGTADGGFFADAPQVVANKRANEYLVTWTGEDDTPPLVAGKQEQFGQLVTGAGVETGTNDFRISQTGLDNNVAAEATPYTGGSYNSVANEFMLVWEADPAIAPLAANKFEIFNRRIQAGTATAPFPQNCKAVPPRGTPNEVKIPDDITAAYLKTNQKTGAATVRRANAIGEWFDAGIDDKDLCGGTLAPEDLGPNLTATSGPLGPNPPEASPRKVQIPKAQPSNATFKANAEQMCINQRIYQAGIARANALRVRLGGELTGGDLKDGVLTQGKLRQDLTITAAAPNPSPPAASQTEVKQPTRAGCETVKFTTQQAAINRRDRHRIGGPHQRGAR